MSPTSAVDLALDYALLGNLVEAEKWLAEAESRTTEMSLPSFSAMKAFTRAVLACRRGRFSDAVTMLEERWSEYEGTLTGESSRPLKIVRAFAITGTGPRNAGVAEVALEAARPMYPGEYDFLGKAWPEMAAFLSSQGL